MEKQNGNHRHWHHVYRRRRHRALATDPKQIAVGQMLSLVGAVLAGYHLDNNKAMLVLIVGAFVVLPGVIDLNGSLGGALSAKINHRLEKPNTSALRVFARGTFFSLLIALLAGAVVGLAGAGIATAFFDADFLTIFKLSIGAIMLSAVIGFPLVGILTVILRKLGVNPDNVMGPVETSFFDFLTVMTFVAVVGWLT